MATTKELILGLPTGEIKTVSEVAGLVDRNKITVRQALNVLRKEGKVKRHFDYMKRYTGFQVKPGVYHEVKMDGWEVIETQETDA